MSSSIKVRLLRSSDDRSNFDWENHDHDHDHDHNRFFRQYAGQNQFRHHIGATYIAHHEEAILGFATVASGQIEIEDLPKSRTKKLPQYPLPVVRLARLAVDRRVQGGGVGKLLLRAVFQIAREMAQTVGCVGIVVDAKPEAVAFYEQYGFEPMEAIEGLAQSRPQPLAMFLALGAIPTE